MNRAEFFATIVPGAVAAEDHYGVPAEMAVAQAAIETGWGSRPIGANWFGIKKADRHKRVAWKITREVLTQAQLDSYRRRFPDRVVSVEARADGRFNVTCREPFADYLNVTAGVMDYAYTVSSLGRYRTRFLEYKATGKVDEYAMGVAEAGYATDPGYGLLLVRILNQKNVRDACAAERNKR